MTWAFKTANAFALLVFLGQIITGSSPFAPQRQRGGSVEGRVVRAGTSEAIRAALVSLESLPSTSPAITDDYGRFRFADVPPGNYRVSVRRDGYLGAEYKQRGPGRPGGLITVPAGQEISDIVIGLTPTGAISGRVYNNNREPQRDALVQLMKYLYVDGQRMLAVWYQARTGVGGDYEFSGLQPGPYVVAAVPRNPAASYLPVYFPGTTDVDAAAPIELPPGITFNGADLNMVDEAASAIRGHVVDGVTGLSPESIFVILSPRARRTTIAGSTSPKLVRVDAGGSFAIEAVPPGWYDLIAFVGDGDARLAARVTLTLGREVEEVRLVLQPGFEVSGRVEIDDFAPPALAANFPRVRVKLVHEPYLAQVGPVTVPVRPDGTFLLKGVTPGDYRVQISTTFESYVVHARLGGADILNSAVGVSGPDQLDIRLSPRVATLDAIVFDNNNAPAQSVQVVLAPDHPNRRRWELYRANLTSSMGHVQLKEIEPGNYKVFALDFMESGAWKDPDLIQRYEEFGTRIQLGPGATDRVTVPIISTRR